MSDPFLEIAPGLLCLLGDTIRDRLQSARATTGTDSWRTAVATTAADTIYAVDRLGEDAVMAWFENQWPAAEPAEVVMEGIDDGDTVTFPPGTAVAATKWKVILDPIDGTRNLMYDKRPAWSLAGLAPQRGAATSLSDIVVAAMTELPTSKQWRADQLSAIRGGGVRGESVDVLRGGRTPFLPRPSQADNFRHGWASFSRFFPEGKALTSAIEEALWDRLYGLGRQATPLVFDDQYLCSGGQLYEIAVGHDRLLADLRPLVFRKLGYTTPLTCHPYDVCNALILQEAGGVVEKPDGNPLDSPLDTTSPVAWIAYANERLAEKVRPLLRPILAEWLG